MSLTKLLSNLHKAYPNPKVELENWNSGIQFMVCVILSAQATDKGVNKITTSLFSKYKTAEDFANADIFDLEKAVSSINFYKTKAKRIQDACQYILANYNGELPKDINLLTKIPGIGRKSANVILISVYGISQGIVVDTHMTRIANRLGLSKYDDQKDAEKIEQDLCKVIPKEDWGFFSTAGVLHGRYVCKARKPMCEACSLNKECPSAFKVGR